MWFSKFVYSDITSIMQIELSLPFDQPNSGMAWHTFLLNLATELPLTSSSIWKEKKNTKAR